MFGNYHTRKEFATEHHASLHADAPSGFKCWLSGSAASLLTFRRLLTEEIADAERDGDEFKLRDLLTEATAYDRWISQHLHHCNDCLPLLGKRFDGGCWK